MTAFVRPVAGFINPFSDNLPLSTIAKPIHKISLTGHRPPPLPFTIYHSNVLSTILHSKTNLLLRSVLDPP